MILNNQSTINFNHKLNFLIANNTVFLLLIIKFTKTTCKNMSTRYCYVRFVKFKA